MLDDLKNACCRFERCFRAPDFDPVYLRLAAKPSQLSLRELARAGLDQGYRFIQWKFAVQMRCQFAVTCRLHRNGVFLEPVRQ